ncbi:carboxypeptidase-like regulatory domain-containing protein [Chryseobacterium sp. G0201]|uniref:carboxypeptidase-like regulatory domain-containing protein n=1 Tax=Chryseobacterium sp. G0201 TaxID=2487065 RepID=UPI0013DE37E6|nr:carboxypeptidase-like regulatory domain-containing protein [Chryseobacterium sp. G0201]
MQKQIITLIFSTITISLLGFLVQQNGSYTQTILKTKSDKVVVVGTVYDTDKNNRTLPGSTIKSTDTTFLTSTDKNGKYHIELSPGKHILRATYIGYQLNSTKTIDLVQGDSIILDFVLKDAKQHTTN